MSFTEKLTKLPSGGVGIRAGQAVLDIVLDTILAVIGDVLSCCFSDM